MMKKETTQVRIPCNQQVKEYNLANIKRLCGTVTPSNLYESLCSGIDVKTVRNITAHRLLDELSDKIDSFVPPVPVANDDLKKIKKFLMNWKNKLQLLTSEGSILSPSPCYLRDKVNELLRRKRCSLQCTNLHLEWYLIRYGSAEMSPEKIASAIVQYSDTNWSQQKAPVNDAEYHIELTENIKERRKEFRDKIEFIADFNYSGDIDALMRKLENDLSVIEEMTKWRKEKPKDYEYVDRYQKLLIKLQTAPKFRLTTVTPTKETSVVNPHAAENFNREQELRETWQNAITGSEGTPLPASSADTLNDIDNANTQESLSGTVRPETEGEDITNADTTIPGEEEYDVQLTREDIIEINKDMLTKCLKDLAGNDAEAQRRINDAAAEIEEFSTFENFDEEFEDLKASIEKINPRNPGGYSVGVVKNKVATHRKAHGEK